MVNMHMARARHFKGLRVSNFKKFLVDHNLAPFLPPLNSKSKQPTMDRQWLINVSDIS